jgi:hypothetical protein
MALTSAVPWMFSDFQAVGLIAIRHTGVPWSAVAVALTPMAIESVIRLVRS